MHHHGQALEEHHRERVERRGERQEELEERRAEREREGHRHGLRGEAHAAPDIGPEDYISANEFDRSDARRGAPSASGYIRDGYEGARLYEGSRGYGIGREQPDAYRANEYEGSGRHQGPGPHAPLTTATGFGRNEYEGSEQYREPPLNQYGEGYAPRYDRPPPVPPKSFDDPEPSGWSQMPDERRYQGEYAPPPGPPPGPSGQTYAPPPGPPSEYGGSAASYYNDSRPGAGYNQERLQQTGYGGQPTSSEYVQSRPQAPHGPPPPFNDAEYAGGQLSSHSHSQASHAPHDVSAISQMAAAHHSSADVAMFHQAAQNAQAAEHAKSQHQGQNRAPLDEAAAQKAHAQAYGHGGGASKAPMDPDALGSAAAVEAIKLSAAQSQSHTDSRSGPTPVAAQGGHTPGPSAPSGGPADKIVALAMSQAAKLFDKHSGGAGGEAASAAKMQAMQTAAQTAMSMIQQYRTTGKAGLEPGDLQKLMGIAMSLF